MAAASATLIPRDPETQSEVWGHRRAIRTLQQAVEHGPGHAYILTGPERVGKRTAAFHFAKLLACADRGDTLQPCGSCTSCRRIDRNVFPDVTQFDLARQAERDKDKSRNVSLNITTVRDIAAAVAYRPLESSWRVIIVDDVDTMQETAQEAFLKTLEEPPPYAVILLLTRDADLMLPTILSRCTLIRFGPVDQSTIASRLMAGGVEHADAIRTAALADGEMGWALDATRDSRLVDTRQQLEEATVSVIRGDAHARNVVAIRMADGFSADREGVYQQLAAMQRCWRRYMYQAAGVVHDETVNRVSGCEVHEAVAAIKAIDECMTHLSANVRPRLALLTMMSTWPAGID